MHPFTAITEFATNDPVAAGILIAVSGAAAAGLFAFINTVCTCGTTILVGHLERKARIKEIDIQAKHHLEHEKMTNNTNKVLKDMATVVLNEKYVQGKG